MAISMYKKHHQYDQVKRLKTVFYFAWKTRSECGTWSKLDRHLYGSYYHVDPWLESMLHYCVDNYYVVTVILEEASLKMGTSPVP
jgi:hypothetical protein